MTFAPPKPDELEVSVFGPGVGESIVIHSGNNRWMIIDSCKGRDGSIAPLAYLNEINVDVATQVDWVVATHAHDDHIAGFSDVVAAAVSADVVLSGALDNDQFFALVDIDADLEWYETRWRIYREHEKAYSTIELDGRLATQFHYATLGLQLPITGPFTPSPPVSLFFVGPSTLAAVRAQRALGAVLKAATGAPVGRLARRDPNSLSSAVIVRCLDSAILLGGDMKNGGPGWGWQVAVATLQVNGDIDAVKVAHHGDPHAHHGAVWAGWLSQEAIAVVAPYRPSRRPRDSDVQRMKATGHELWQTSEAQPIAKSKAARRATAKLRNVATKVEEEGGLMGHVCYRKASSGAVSVATRGPAFLA